MSMQQLSESFVLHNPPADKLSYYFKNKFYWEAKKDKIVEIITKKSKKLSKLEFGHSKKYKAMKYTSN
jgi:hypothetical protein